MRVLVVCERLPSRVGGGASRQFNLMRELSHRHAFTVVTYAYPADLRNLGTLRSIADRVEFVELAMPVRILCSEDCAGLCPSCGANRNLVEECGCEPEIDPRWSALAALKDGDGSS